MKKTNLIIPILIPAYQPDRKLLKLVKQLTDLKIKQIIIINDGSGKSADKIFQNLKKQSVVHLIDHKKNMGKGRALKTGLAYILKNKKTFGDGKIGGCITVDADGQHDPSDVLAIQKSLRENPKSLILGSRTFDQKVPFKNKLGNIITGLIFSRIIGYKINDTQTGLRGIPLSFFKKALSLDGDGYEYEINMLIATKEANVRIIEEPIKTIYLDGNKSSHFNPLLDSVKIYFQLLKFISSSIGAAAIDYVCFFIFINIGLTVKNSIILSRLVSGNFQYLVNKKKVFEEKGDALKSFIKYWILVLVLGTLAYFGILFLNQNLKINIMVSKVVVELTLFICSFVVQKKLIFNGGGTSEKKNNYDS